MIEMLKIFSLVYTGTYFMTIFFIYCWRKLLDINNKILKKDYLICIIITFFTSCFLVFIRVYPIKIILNIFILIVFNYYLYTKNIKKIYCSSYITSNLNNDIGGNIRNNKYNYF